MAAQTMQQEISQEALIIDEMILKAKKAQKAFEAGADQGRYDNAALAAAWALMEPGRNSELAHMAVETTGLGNVQDKIIKNHRKTLGVLRDIQHSSTCGIIEDDPKTGITKIARPVGVVGAVVPSTNPVATPANNIINALKCGNAIILSPSPKGVSVCEKLVGYIHAEFDKLGLDHDLVQIVPSPSSKVKTQRLMELCDLLVVTGSQDNVRRAYSSGTPAIGVGAGNVTVIVDETANLQDAAEKITASKCFDNATSCSSENVLVVVDAVYDAFMAQLHQAGGRLLDGPNSEKMKTALFQNGHLNRDIIAHDIDQVIRVAEVEVADAESAKFLLIEGAGIGADYPESGEKLSLVTTIYRASDFDDAKRVAAQIMDHQGAGHSIGLHTESDARAVQLGLEMPTCRVIVNQAHCFATGGSFDNGMPFSLSMGCGSWGGNSIDENFNHKHLMNITKIVRTIPSNEPSLDDVFANYWEKTSSDTGGTSLKPGQATGSVRDMIDERAANSPNEVFVIDAVSEAGSASGAKKKINYRELREKAAHVAAHIRAMDIEPGSSVAYALGNSPSSAITILGIMYGGFVATALNLVSGKKTLAYILDHSEAKLILTDAPSREIINEVIAEDGLSVPVVDIAEGGIFDDPADIHYALEAVPVSGDDRGLLMYTSGTTGQPKGVVLTHGNLLAGGKNTALAHQLTDADRALCTLPLYHINGLCVTLFGPLVSGGSVVIPPRFSVSEFWRTIRENECSWFSVVPTQISYLLHKAKTNGEPFESIPSLRFGRSASAPLSPDIQEAFEGQFNIPIIETMGLTETAAQILSNPLPPGVRKIGSPGIAFGNEIMVCDETFHEVARGVQGEVLVRGSNVMQCYFKNEEVTKDNFTSDGWLRTGDLGHMDEDGYVFITGRLKEIIIKGGENIAPREIDDALYSHPDVVEAAAFAQPCKDYGQRIEAGVMLKEGSAVSEEELISLCREKVGAFKSPDRIYFLPELPKGPSGKIQRIKLNDLFPVSP